MAMRGGGVPDEWQDLFVGIEAVAALPGIRSAWPSGLSHGQPGDVLVRLLGLVTGLEMEKLPVEAVEAGIAHPHRRVRMRMAEHQRGMSLDQWVRLIASEPEGVYRRRIRAMAAWHCPRPSEADFEGWAGDPDPQVRLRALWFRGLPGHVAAALAADPDPEVRTAACREAWPHLDAERRSALESDAVPQVREAAQKRAGLDRPMALEEYDALGTTEQWLAAREQHLDPGLARHLLRYPEYGLRATLAENAWLEADLVAALARDSDDRVRAEVAVRPDATETIRAEVTAGLPANHPHPRVLWVEDLHDDPDAMRRLASSASIAIRRSVARARRLPPDVLDRLARDPESSVRSTLAGHNERAPVDMLLDAAFGWPHPWPVLNRPDFPFDGLSGLGDDPDPMRRRLALYAPDATADLAERLADDPDEGVRFRAASDPRLSPATVLRLLASTDRDFEEFRSTRGLPVPATHRIRAAAIRNPRLPVPTLIGLLRDPDTAQNAAANPAIPAAVAHRMIDLVAGAD
ncbi:hypothetical protein GCM10010441_25010 [Kitasatospora paracochleata]|uniref:Leucine rich repeat (LRR) protein n=1 Tax=Kitasatospora paracochleata TaxID=58354 RepID=A0ABT1J1U4_9ACTN|nr:PE-PGRS family protein [Kitasatospora paracochleata]MCP2311056.1 hypothetical protein [Kitasatospora paracochleata]